MTSIRPEYSELPSGFYLPVQIMEDDRFCFSVDVDLPEDVAAEYDRRAFGHELSSRTVEIHGALYVYRGSEMTVEEREAEFEDIIQRALDSGPLIEDNEEFRRQIRNRCERRWDAIQRLTEDGKLGNLLLPEELYEFVLVKVRTGVHANPTDVIVAALAFPQANCWGSHP